jgi:hypothetical protein
VLLRFHTLQNLNDTTGEVQEFEYSGLCFYALEEQCWREAMKTKLESIQSNRTWELAPSSCEAEYIASANAACQGIWLSRLLSEMLRRKVPEVKLLEDNKSAVVLSKNPVTMGKAKSEHFYEEYWSEQFPCFSVAPLRTLLLPDHTQ